MNKKANTSFSADRILIILLIASFFLIGFHFQDSCRASGLASAAGSVMAGAVFIFGVMRKKEKLAFFSLMVFFAHMLLAH